MPAGTQSRKFQRQIIDAALADGSLAKLYWFVEMVVPNNLRGTTNRIQSANWPTGWIPVICAGPDPETQEVWAALMQWSFELANAGTGIEFCLALTTADLLEGLPHYEFGDIPQAIAPRICHHCGSVYEVAVHEDADCDICGAWLPSPCRPSLKPILDNCQERE